MSDCFKRLGSDNSVAFAATVDQMYTETMMLAEELGLCPSCTLVFMMGQLVTSYLANSGGTKLDRLPEIAYAATSAAIEQSKQNGERRAN